MVDVSTLISGGSTLIGFISLIVAIAVVINNSHKDNKSETASNIEVHAALQGEVNTLSKTIDLKLNNISDDIKDLKADNRSVSNQIDKLRDEFKIEMREIHDEARHATELAEAAHRRLDRAGVEPAFLSVEKEKTNDKSKSKA